MRCGVAPFNGILVGTVIASLYPTVYQVEMDLKMWIFISLGSICRYVFRIYGKAFLHAAATFGKRCMAIEAWPKRLRRTSDITTLQKKVRQPAGVGQKERKRKSNFQSFQ